MYSTYNGLPCVWSCCSVPLVCSSFCRYLSYVSLPTDCVCHRYLMLLLDCTDKFVNNNSTPSSKDAGLCRVFVVVKNTCCNWSLPEFCLWLICVFFKEFLLPLVCERIMFITGLWLVFVQNTHLTNVSVLCYSWFKHEVRVSQKSVLCSFWFLHEVRVVLISVLCYRWFNCQVLVWLVPVLCYHWFIHQVLCNQFCLMVPLVCSPRSLCTFWCCLWFLQ